MSKRILTICGIVLVAVVANVYASWDVGSSAKWVQLPDLNPTGVDVQASYPKILADDFLCNSPGPITGIHIWGSWLRDEIPERPDNVGFILRIYSDVPAGPGGANYSHPGEILWEKAFEPGEFEVRPYAVLELPEWWYDPNTGEAIPNGDYVVWQYNFKIDPRDAFYQEGTGVDPTVYWLSVQAFPPTGSPEPYYFGWKSSYQHWNDDAVWSDDQDMNGIPDFPWRELRYPDQHPYAERSMDLAFVIVPEPMSFLTLILGLAGLVSSRRSS